MYAGKDPSEMSLTSKLFFSKMIYETPSIRQSTFCRHSILPANDIQLLASRIRTLSAIKGYDAEHIACAELTECDYLLTGDDRLLRQFNHLKAQRVLPLRVVLQNPVDFLRTQLEEEKSRER